MEDDKVVWDETPLLLTVVDLTDVLGHIWFLCRL